MNTGTLTFHAPNNNGSFLQAYALQKVLKRYSVQNTIINFYTDRQEKQYSVFRKPNSIGDLIRNVLSLFHYSALNRRFFRFHEMRENYLEMTNRYKTEEEVLQNLAAFDILICGSDQIWNTEARDYSELFFLPKVDRRKITYAVSCGSHIENINLKKVLYYAKDFDALSVREMATLNVLKEGNQLDTVEIVLDPTFLLTKEEYKELYGEQPIINGKYIFLYTINYDDSVLKTVAKFAKVKDYPVYTPFTGYSSYKCRKYGINVLYDIAPDGFLNLLDHAAFVFSNSFHGIAFSIIYRKEFYRVCNLDIDGNEILDDRIDSILQELHLEDRKVNEKSKVLIQKIDYTKTEVYLRGLKEKSLNYLLKALMIES